MHHPSGNRVKTHNRGNSTSTNNATSHTENFGALKESDRNNTVADHADRLSEYAGSSSRPTTKKNRGPLSTSTKQLSSAANNKYDLLQEDHLDKVKPGARGRKNSRSQGAQSQNAPQIASPAPSTATKRSLEDNGARNLTGGDGNIGQPTPTINRWNRNVKGTRPLSSQHLTSSDTERNTTVAAKTEVWSVPSIPQHGSVTEATALAAQHRQFSGDNNLSVDVAKANGGTVGMGQLPHKPDASLMPGLSTVLSGLPSRHGFSSVSGTAHFAEGAGSNLGPAHVPVAKLPTTTSASSAAIPLPTISHNEHDTPTIDPRILDQAVRTVLSEKFGVSSLNQLPHPLAQSLLSGPLPQLIASYLQSNLSTVPIQTAASNTKSVPVGSQCTKSGEAQPERAMINTSQQPSAPPIALLPASPAPFPADALPSEIQNEQNTNLYLNGLGDYVTDDELLRIGSQFGEVISHKAIINSETGLCKGYGFIMFAWAKDAAVAMVELQKRGYQTSFARHESFSAKLRMMSDVRSTNVYVSNLPLTMTDQQLEQLVAPHTIVSRRILTKADGTSRGVGFVRFHSRDVAQDCIDRLHGKRLIGHPHPLQARFADSENQKRLKQDTSLRKVYADLDMGVLANHPASTSTRRSVSQTSFGSLARSPSHAVTSAGMATGRSDPGSLTTGHQTIGGIPMISPTNSLAGFYPGPIGAPASPSPLWTATTLNHRTQQNPLQHVPNVWSPANTVFPVLSSPSTPATIPAPPYWNHKAGAAEGSGQHGNGNGTPSLSPSGSASTLNSPAVSLDVLGQNGNSNTIGTTLNYPPQNALQFSGSLPTSWAISQPSNVDVERQLKNLSLNPSPQVQNPFVFDHNLSAYNNNRQHRDLNAALEAAGDRNRSAKEGSHQQPAEPIPPRDQILTSADIANFESNGTFDGVGMPGNALQASNFIRASAQKAAIPIVNPETGRAWMVSGSPTTTGDSDSQHDEAAKKRQEVLASISAPIVTVSPSGETTGSSPLKSTAAQGCGEESKRTSPMPTSSSAPAALSASDQQQSNRGEEMSVWRA